MKKILVGILIIFSSCSDDKSDKAREELEKRINTESEGAISLLEFNKTDGAELNLLGVSGYVINFNAVIEYKKDCYKNWKGADTQKEIAYSDFIVDESSWMADGDFAMDNGHSEKMKAGTRVKLTGNAFFAKKESGWNIGKIEIVKVVPF